MKKYNVTSYQYISSYSSGWTSGSAFTHEEGITGYNNYSFNSSTGLYSVIGDSTWKPYGTVYVSNGNGVYDAASLRKISTYVDYKGYEYVTITTPNYSTNYTKGTYIETIEAEDGTYPVNGTLDYVYWYVKTTVVFPELNFKIDGVFKS